MWHHQRGTDCRWVKFLLTHPVWDVTIIRINSRTGFRFLLTHPVWDVTNHRIQFVSNDVISTHTSRVGCDNIPQETFANKQNFYSHIPCGMWRGCNRSYWGITGFLLTHPVWDVTQCKWVVFLQSYFYSHIPCGMWLPQEAISPCLSSISTHTSRVGCDRINPARTIRPWNFYSHIPCGMWLYTYFVSKWVNHFYSHIPCGMWPLYIVYFNHIIPIYYRMDL